MAGSPTRRSRDLRTVERRASRRSAPDTRSRGQSRRPPSSSRSSDRRGTDANSRQVRDKWAARDIEIRIEIDETSPLGRNRLESLDPVTISAEGGALEDAKRPRQLSEKSVIDVIGRLLFRAKDRLDPAFAGAPPDSELTLQQHTAWDTYAVGRLRSGRVGAAEEAPDLPLPHRHGFTDVADAVFERLWSAEGLTWADIDAACAETDAGRVAAG